MGDSAELKRDPLVSPEWTFQLINAYERMAYDFSENKEYKKAEKYKKKKDELLQSMIRLAVSSDDGLGYPYATQEEALIGHEHRTPQAGTLSNIGASYGILALTGFDPLHADPFKEPDSLCHTK